MAEMLDCVERRFEALRAPQPVQWLADNEDYNTTHPHPGLHMRSAREFIAQQSPTKPPVRSDRGYSTKRLPSCSRQAAQC
jgi:hypothetical protein